MLAFALTLHTLFIAVIAVDRVRHNIARPNGDVARINPNIRNPEELTLPQSVGFFQNYWYNAFGGYAEYLGTLKKAQAAIKTNELARQIESTEEIRTRCEQIEINAELRLTHIRNMIRDAMRGFYRSIDRDSETQSRNIQRARTEYVDECNRISRVLDAPHTATTCPNCVALDVSINAYQTFMQDEELMQATMDALESFRRLAAKSLHEQRKDGTHKNTFFTDLQFDVRSQRNNLLFERPTTSFQRSRVGRNILDTISINVFPHPDKRDTGSDAHSLILRTINDVNNALNEFRHIDDLKKTVVESSSAVLDREAPFLEVDAKIQDATPGAQDMADMQEAATRLCSAISKDSGYGVETVQALFKELTQAKAMSPARLAQANNIAAETCKQANENYSLVQQSALSTIAKIDKIKTIINQIDTIRDTQISEEQIANLHNAARQANDLVIRDLREAQEATRTCYTSAVSKFSKVENSEECLVELSRKLVIGGQDLENRFRTRIHEQDEQDAVSLPDQPLGTIRRTHTTNMQRLETLLIDRIRVASSGDMSTILGDSSVHEALHSWLRIHNVMAQEYLDTLTADILVKRYYTQQIIGPVLLVLFLICFQTLK